MKNYLLVLSLLLLVTACGDDPSVNRFARQESNVQVEADLGFVTLAFDPNTEPDLAGYRLHWGLVSGAYTNHKNIGRITENTINGLAPGVGYFFAVTAYDREGFESDFSDEIPYTLTTALINWTVTQDEPHTTNETYSFVRDPVDGLTYFYTHFQWKGHPNVKYKLTYKHDLNAPSWTEIEQFNVRPSTVDPLADRTVYSTYRYYPVPLAVFYRIQPTIGSGQARLDIDSNEPQDLRVKRGWRPVSTLRVIE